MFPDRIKADTVVILAHPDDEGVIAPLLARYALEEKQRIVALYLTSGESGTNRTGNVRGPAFAAMRLTELHWTLDRLGVAMFHTLGRSDGGRGDDPATILAGWDTERTVGVLTRHIRLMRPDRILTWYPGPASSHPDHMAAGGAALLACRAAASPDAYPEQMSGEGLRPYAVPEALVFAQPEKLGYERYPDPAGRRPALAAAEVPVDVFSPPLGRRYTDVAREALKEQRATAAASNVRRGGPFDEPLRLIRALGAGADATRHASADDGAGPVDARTEVLLSLKASGSQRFLEQIAQEIGSPGLGRIFLPQAIVGGKAADGIAVRVSNAGRTRLRGRAVLEAPPEFHVRPPEVDLELGPGQSADLSWTVEPASGEGTLYAVAEVVILRASRGRDEIARMGLVLRRGGGAGAGAAPPPDP